MAITYASYSSDEAELTHATGVAFNAARKAVESRQGADIGTRGTTDTPTNETDEVMQSPEQCVQTEEEVDIINASENARRHAEVWA
jgi:hypothetical protein